MIKKQDKIRVLIVDDSFFMRKLIREILSSDPEIEIIDDAKDGVEAIGKAARLEPDVIIMDYNMPQMNGAEATQKILGKVEKLPVILMLSAYTTEGAEATLECLRAGAVDFIAKPSGELSLDIDKVSEEIITKVKKLAQAQVKKFEKIKSFKKSKKPLVKIEKKGTKIIVIGASTGGPPILEDIFANLPEDLNAVIIVVQHMPKYFTETFAKRLDKVSPLFVKEAERGEVLKAGMAFIAPGGYHTKIEKRKKENDLDFEMVINLTKEPIEYGFWPSIDVSMMSVAQYYPYGIIGILLSGMGGDGVEGLRAIKSVNGHNIVQDPATAVVASMPEAAIREGLEDEILPPEKIAKRIIELTT